MLARCFVLLRSQGTTPSVISPEHTNLYKAYKELAADYNAAAQHISLTQTGSGAPDEPVLLDLQYLGMTPARHPLNLVMSERRPSHHGMPSSMRRLEMPPASLTDSNVAGAGCSVIPGSGVPSSAAGSLGGALQPFETPLGPRLDQAPA